MQRTTCQRPSFCRHPCYSPASRWSLDPCRSGHHLARLLTTCALSESQQLCPVERFQGPECYWLQHAQSAQVTPIGWCVHRWVRQQCQVLGGDACHYLVSSRAQSCSAALIESLHACFCHCARRMSIIVQQRLGLQRPRAAGCNARPLPRFASVRIGSAWIVKKPAKTTYVAAAAEAVSETAPKFEVSDRFALQQQSIVRGLYLGNHDPHCKVYVALARRC